MNRAHPRRNPPVTAAGLALTLVTPYACLLAIVSALAYLTLDLLEEMAV